MTYPKEVAYKQSVSEGGYSILFEAHEASQPGKWMGSYKVRKGSLVVAEAAVANAYDSERECDDDVYRLAEEAIEKHAAGGT